MGITYILKSQAKSKEKNEMSRKWLSKENYLNPEEAKYLEKNGLYPTRYAAKKAMSYDAYICSDSAIVKVEGGYKILSWSDYHTWRAQK